MKLSNISSLPFPFQINLDGCCKLTEVSIWRLLKSCSKLHLISIKAADVGIIHLPNSYNGSTVIRVHGCPLIMPSNKVYRQEMEVNANIETKHPYFDCEHNFRSVIFSFQITV